jgi:ADP-dependent NAD(P)H-hydrate dehydratase / NAD(P)H-hydrate epimerase
MVRLGSPGGTDDRLRPVEAVGLDLPREGWAGDVLDATERFGSLVIGPGLGTTDATTAAVREVVARAPVPVLVDGDGLTSLGTDAAEVIARRSAPTVLTPHDGEAARLTEEPPSPDRLAATRDLAATTGAVVLLKGATTVVADPDGHTRVVTAGDPRLATAGTGDVLSGAIGALLASSVGPLEAAAAGAWLHGRAAAHGHAHGLVASDLVDLLPFALDEVLGAG